MSLATAYGKPFAARPTANEIKVLFAYTKKAALEVGDGFKNIYKLVKSSVDQTNQAMSSN